MKMGKDCTSVRSFMMGEMNSVLKKLLSALIIEDIYMIVLDLRILDS